MVNNLLFLFLYLEINLLNDKNIEYYRNTNKKQFEELKEELNKFNN